MFTIEHEFEATVITLVDEGDAHDDGLFEDVIIHAYEDCVTVEQLDPESGEVETVVLSQGQLRELAAALDLPEGAYRLRQAKDSQA
jgi:hypothetical protein